MSNIVEQINDAIEARLTAVLGAEWKELDYKYDVEQNTFRGNKKRFGVVPAPAFRASGVTRSYTADHDFRVTLTTDYLTSNSNDDSKQASVFLLYDKLDDIIVDIFINNIHFCCWRCICGLIPLSL